MSQSGGSLHVKGQGSPVGEPRAAGHGDTESRGGAAPDMRGGAGETQIKPEKPQESTGGAFRSPREKR